MRKITIVGWDGRSNAMYRFEDELKLSDWARTYPSLEQVLEQFPNAKWCNSQFEVVPLRDAGVTPYAPTAT